MYILLYLDILPVIAYYNVVHEISETVECDAYTSEQGELSLLKVYRHPTRTDHRGVPM